MASREDIARTIPLLERRLSMDRMSGDLSRAQETLFYLALGYDFLAQYEKAYAAYQEVLPLARSVEDREQEKIALMGSAGALTHLRRYHDALPAWKAALQCIRDLSDRDAETEALAHYGFTLTQAQMPDQAIPLLREALERMREAGNRKGEANTLNLLGVALSTLGRVQEALQAYEQALALARAAGDKEEQAYHLGNIGHEYVDHLGQPELSIPYFQAALTLFRDIGDHKLRVQTLYNLGRAYQLCGKSLQAERVLRQGQSLSAELVDSEMRMRILELLSEVMAAQGHLEEAVELKLQERETEDPLHSLKRHSEARTHAHERGDTRAEAYHLGEVATALGVLDYRADAISANLEAIVLFRALGDRHGEGICFVNIGTHCYFLEQFPECLACWSYALELLGEEEFADVEMLRLKLEQVKEQWGRRAFDQHKQASAPFLRQVKQARDGDLRTLFGHTLLLAQAKDNEERIDEKEFPVLAALMDAERAMSSHGATTSGTPGLLANEFPVDLEVWGAFGLDDPDESERLIRDGRRALLKKVYWQAQECFEEAMEFDPDQLTSAQIWYALSCLWTGEVGLNEAALRFGEVAAEGDIAGEGALARLLEKWSAMCEYPTRQAYLDSLRALYACESEEDFQDLLTPFTLDVQRGEAEGKLHAGLMYAVIRDYEACLQILSDVDVTGHPMLPWIRSFWQAMSHAERGEEELAVEKLYAALAYGLPPLLMGPLRWLKPDNDEPTSWFARVVRPLFATNHLYGERPGPLPPGGELTLPSQVVRLLPNLIRRGIPVLGQELQVEAGELQLDLTSPFARGPGGLAQLAFVEFDEGLIEGQGKFLWPTKFAVRYEHAQSKIADRWQEYWINYNPFSGRNAVLLVDCGFRSKTDPIPTAGRDYLVGHGSYGGRGGIFWVAEPHSPLVLALGTTIRLDHLPPGTRAYLQALVDEALPRVEVYCEVCDKQVTQVCGVWCEHIWFCTRCQHISSPVERSRKLIGESPRHCEHRFPRQSTLPSSHL